MKVDKVLSGHDMYAAIGVILWHIRLRGIPFGLLRESLRQLYEPIQECITQQDWSLQCCIPTKQQRILRQWLTDATSNQTFVREMTRPPLRFNAVASDASNWGWAFVDRTGIRMQAPWSKPQQDWHINVKETFAAIQAVWYFARHRSHSLVAVDNQVAKTWLSDGWDISRMEGQWFAELSLHLQELEATIEVVYIRSEENPADGASRGQTTYECDVNWWKNLQHLAEQPKWFQETNKAKRPRVEDEELAV